MLSMVVFGRYTFWLSLGIGARGFKLGLRLPQLRDFIVQIGSMLFLCKALHA